MSDLDNSNFGQNVLVQHIRIVFFSITRDLVNFSLFNLLCFALTLFSTARLRVFGVYLVHFRNMRSRFSQPLKNESQISNLRKGNVNFFEVLSHHGS